MNAYGTLLAPIAFGYHRLGAEVQTEIEALLSKATYSEFIQGAIYEYRDNTEGYDGWGSDTFSLTLYPNGSCRIFDQHVSDRDTHTDYSSFGKYKITDTTLEMDMIYYNHSANWDTDYYYTQVELEHYSFERDLKENVFISNTNFRACHSNLPTTLTFREFIEEAL
jgi:hypothetical protein